MSKESVEIIAMCVSMAICFVLFMYAPDLLILFGALGFGLSSAMVFGEILKKEKHED